MRKPRTTSTPGQQLAWHGTPPWRWYPCCKKWQPTGWASWPRKRRHAGGSGGPESRVGTLSGQGHSFWSEGQPGQGSAELDGKLWRLWDYQCVTVTMMATVVEWHERGAQALREEQTRLALEASRAMGEPEEVVATIWSLLIARKISDHCRLVVFCADYKGGLVVESVAGQRYPAGGRRVPSFGRDAWCCWSPRRMWIWRRSWPRRSFRQHPRSASRSSGTPDTIKQPPPQGESIAGCARHPRGRNSTWTTTP